MAIDPRVCGRLKNISDKELCALSLTGTSTTDSLTDGLSILFCIWLVEKTLFIKQLVQIFRSQYTWILFHYKSILTVLPCEFGKDVSLPSNELKSFNSELIPICTCRASFSSLNAVTNRENIFCCVIGFAVGSPFHTRDS